MFPSPKRGKKKKLLYGLAICGLLSLLSNSDKPPFQCEKKYGGVSTALGMVGCAQVKRVPDGENSEVVWFGLFFAGSDFYLIGFGVLWKLESPFTLILLCVTFSFGKIILCSCH